MRSPLTRPGGTPLPRSLLQQCEGTGAPREDGTLLESGHIAATWVHDHTSNLGISNVPFVSFRRF